MSKYETAKNVLEGVVGTSVGMVVQTVIAHNTPANLKFLPRMGMKVGTLVIGSLLSTMASKKATEGLDTILEGVKKGVELAEAEEAEKAADLKAALEQAQANQDEADVRVAEAVKATSAKRKPATKKIDTTLPNPEA